MRDVAVVGGIGEESEFSSELLRAFLEKGFYVVAISRNTENKRRLLSEFKDVNELEFVSGDLTDSVFLSSLSYRLENEVGPVRVYIHNAAKLVIKPFLDLDTVEFEDCWKVSVKTAVTASKAFLPAMLERGEGTLLFSGATASIKGNAKSSPFAVAKFGLRALSQSLAREFTPQGIHIAHIIVDGVIKGNRAQNTFKMDADKCIQAKALAALYVNLIEQDKSCWTQEIDVRPMVESF